MDPAADPREPCPECGRGIRPGARKCPHCRCYLDPDLARDRRAQVAEQAQSIADHEHLCRQVRDSTVQVGIASLPLCFAGPIAGPLALGYALSYQNRARKLQLGEPRYLRLLFGFAGLWTATGVIFWAVLWFLSWRRAHGY